MFRSFIVITSYIVLSLVAFPNCTLEHGRITFEFVHMRRGSLQRIYFNFGVSSCRGVAFSISFSLLYPGAFVASIYIFSVETGPVDEFSSLC